MNGSDVPERRWTFPVCAKCDGVIGLSIGSGCTCDRRNRKAGETVEVMRVEDHEQVAGAQQERRRDGGSAPETSRSDLLSRLPAALVDLREAVARHLRYLDGEIVSGLRDGRHTPEVAANIGEQQSRNLRQALEITGPLQIDGRAGPSFRAPEPSSSDQKREGRAGPRIRSGDMPDLDALHLEWYELLRKLRREHEDRDALGRRP